MQPSFAEFTWANGDRGPDFSQWHLIRGSAVLLPDRLEPRWQTPSSTPDSPIVVQGATEHARQLLYVVKANSTTSPGYYSLVYY